MFLTILTTTMDPESLLPFGQLSATPAANRNRPPIDDSAASVVVFLDIDGVLLPFGGTSDVSPSSCNALFPDSTLAALSLLLDGIAAFPTPENNVPRWTTRVVLSSTWRVHPQYRQEIVDSCRLYGKQFGGPLRKFHLDGITNAELHSFRQAEIDDWLQRQQNEDESIAAWVALDDEDLLGGSKNAPRRHYFDGRVVQTHSAIGLTEHDARTALRLLHQQLQLDLIVKSEVPPMDASLGGGDGW